MDVNTITVLVGIISVLWLIVQYLFAKWVKRIEEDVKMAILKSDEAIRLTGDLKLNYIERFNKIERLINDKHEVLIKNISDLKDHLSNKFVSKELCKFYHDEDGR